MANNSEDSTSKAFYEEALYVVLTLIRNFSGEELFKMATDISKIVKLIFGKLNRADDWSARLNFLAQLKNVHLSKSPEQLKREVKKLKAEESKGNFMVYKISTLESDRKNLLSAQNIEVIKVMINEQLLVAGQVEERLKTQRKEAAAKIFAYWLRKR